MKINSYEPSVPSYFFPSIIMYVVVFVQDMFVTKHRFLVAKIKSIQNVYVDDSLTAQDFQIFLS